MTLLFFILIVIACAILGLIVLIQNPKGGGLSGTFGGFSNQLMGVKQTTDVLEKGTWLFAAIIGVLCLVSTAFLKGGPSTNTINTKDLPTISTPSNQANPLRK
jgi:preprotein translocase subunit SecG